MILFLFLFLITDLVDIAKNQEQANTRQHPLSMKSAQKDKRVLCWLHHVIIHDVMLARQWKKGYECFFGNFMEHFLFWMLLVPNLNLRNVHLGLTLDKGPGSNFLGTIWDWFEANWILELDYTLVPSLILGSPNQELSF